MCNENVRAHVLSCGRIGVASTKEGTAGFATRFGFRMAGVQGVVWAPAMAEVEAVLTAYQKALLGR